MKPLPPDDLAQILAQTKDLWPKVAGAHFVIIGHKGFVGSWMAESLIHASNTFGLGVKVSVARLPCKLAAHDYAIVAPSWDVPIDWGKTFCKTKKAVLFISSGAVTERTDGLAKKKRADEIALKAAGKKYGFAVKIARGYSFIGPRLPEGQGLAAAEFLKADREKTPLKIWTPDNLRSYLYASDMASWLWKILFRGSSGRAYSVGSHLPTTIGELAIKISRKGKKQAAPSTSAYTDVYLPNTIFTRYGLGVSQTVNLDEAIRRTKAWQSLP